MLLYDLSSQIIPQQSEERDFRDGGTDINLGIAEQGGVQKNRTNF